MPSPRCRISAVAAALLFLVAANLAQAQLVILSASPRESGGLLNELVTGVAYDRANQVKAERRLVYLQTKLRRDIERGNPDAAARDGRRIDRDRYRIAVNDWLIRKNSLEDLGYYPIRTDELSCVAIADVARPAEFSFPRQDSDRPRASLAPPSSTPTPTATPTPSLAPAAPATIAITVVNSEATGPDVAYAIGGASYQAAAGSRRELTVASDAVISYEGSGSGDPVRYQLSPGPYEFRMTALGWSLFKSAVKP